MSPEPAAASASLAPQLLPRRAMGLWALAAIPVVVLAALIAWIVKSGPADALGAHALPPVERLAFTQVRLAPGLIELSVLNDGPDEVTIAQVLLRIAIERLVEVDLLPLSLFA